jgi:Protein of unknown function (DUF1360)
MKRKRNHPQPVDIAVDVLTVFRLTRLLQVDTIPPIPKLRQAALDKLARTPYGAIVDCAWCLSVWIGLLVAVARRASPRVWGAVSWVLASSAVTGLMTSWVDSLDPEPIEVRALPTWSGPERNEL